MLMINEIVIYERVNPVYCKVEASDGAITIVQDVDGRN